MDKSNTNYIATQDEAKTIAQSSKSVVMGRLATKECALSLGCSVAGNYSDNQCVKWTDLSKKADQYYNIYTTVPSVGYLTNVEENIRLGERITIEWYPDGNISYIPGSWVVTKRGDASTKVSYTTADNTITFIMPNYDVDVKVNLTVYAERNTMLTTGNGVVVLSVAGTPAERVLATGGSNPNTGLGDSAFNCVSGTVPVPYPGIAMEVSTEMSSDEDEQTKYPNGYDREMFKNPYVINSTHILGKKNDLALMCCTSKIDIWLKVYPYENVGISALTFSGKFWSDEDGGEYTKLVDIPLYNADGTPRTGYSWVSSDSYLKRGYIFYSLTYNTQSVDDSYAGWLVHFIYYPNISYIRDNNKNISFSYMDAILLRTLKIGGDDGGIVGDSIYEFTIDFDYDEVNRKTLQNRRQQTNTEGNEWLYGGMSLKGGLNDIYLWSMTMESKSVFICHPLKYPLDLCNSDNANLWEIPGAQNYDGGVYCLNGMTPFDIAGNIYYFHNSNDQYNSSGEDGDDASILDTIGAIYSKRPGETALHYGFTISFLNPDDSELNLDNVILTLGNFVDMECEGDTYNFSFPSKSDITEYNLYNGLFNNTPRDDVAFPDGLIGGVKDELPDIVDTFNNYGLLRASISDLKKISDNLHTIEFENTTTVEGGRYTGCYAIDVSESDNRISITFDWTELAKTGCSGNLLENVITAINNGGTDDIKYAGAGIIWVSLQYGQHGYAAVMNPFSNTVQLSDGEGYLKWWNSMRTTDNYMNPTYNCATDENNSTAVLDVREYDDNDIGNRYGLVNYPAR